MLYQQTAAYIRDYIHQQIRDGILNLVVKIATFVLEWTITLAVGYEVQKITSDEKKDVWTYVEFCGILAVCVLIWLIKCCCVNKFCINCCINCFNKNRNQPDIEAGRDENGERMGLAASILEKIHMILNRLVIGAVGFEIRKQVFKFKPLTTWDYVEISLIASFCVWIISIKYCILKCYCLRCCCPCCFKNQNEIETIEIRANNTQGEATATDGAETIQSA